MLGLGINKPLVSSFGQGISSLQSSEFSFSTLCLYTTKSTKNKIRDLLTSGLKEQYRRGSWNEGDLQKKEQLLAAMNVRSLCVKEASDL